MGRLNWNISTERRWLGSLEPSMLRRKEIWNTYYAELLDWGLRNQIALQKIPQFASNNAHMFYLVLHTLEARDAFISDLRKQNIHAVFHYQSLHKSPYFENKHDGREIPFTNRFSECLVRLPFFNELDVHRVLNSLQEIC